MIWICMIIFNLLIGVGIGIMIMYYKDRNLLKNQKNLYNELQNNKTQLNEYQKRLNNHFSDNIELLNKIAENYRNLYQNMIKNASFFLPNTHTKDNTCSFYIKNEHKTNDECLPMEVPRDYSEKTEIFQKENKKIK